MAVAVVVVVVVVVKNGVVGVSQKNFWRRRNCGQLISSSFDGRKVEQQWHWEVEPEMLINGEFSDCIIDCESNDLVLRGCLWRCFVLQKNFEVK